MIAEAGNGLKYRRVSEMGCRLIWRMGCGFIPAMRPRNSVKIVPVKKDVPKTKAPASARDYPNPAPHGFDDLAHMRKRDPPPSEDTVQFKSGRIDESTAQKSCGVKKSRRAKIVLPEENAAAPIRVRVVVPKLQLQKFLSESKDKAEFIESIITSSLRITKVRNVEGRALAGGSLTWRPSLESIAEGQ